MAFGRVPYYEIQAFERRPLAVELASPEDERDEPVTSVVLPDLDAAD